MVLLPSEFSLIQLLWFHTALPIHRGMVKVLLEYNRVQLQRYIFYECTHEQSWGNTDRAELI